MFQEKKFLSDQKTHLDTTLLKIISNNKREIAEMERECLDKKHHLIRGGKTSFILSQHPRPRFEFKLSYFPVLTERESTIWDLEEKNLHERHQLLKQQLKDLFFLQRHQLVKKHEKVNLLLRSLPFGFESASTSVLETSFFRRRSWNTCSATTSA